MRPVVLVLIAAFLLALGGVFGYTSAQWTAERIWTLDIQAPRDLQWRVRFPHPAPPMPVEITGIASVGAAESTAHGLLGNASGVGNVTIRYVLTERLLVWGADPSRGIGTPVGPSGGRDSEGFWLWRESSDPSSTIRAFGHGSSSVSHWDYRSDGPLFAYRGNLEEGWTVLQPLAAGASILIGQPTALELSVAFFVAGTTLAVLAASARRLGFVKAK